MAGKLHVILYHNQGVQFAQTFAHKLNQLVGHAPGADGDFFHVGETQGAGQVDVLAFTVDIQTSDRLHHALREQIEQT